MSLWIPLTSSTPLSRHPTIGQFLLRIELHLNNYIVFRCLFTSVISCNGCNTLHLCDALHPMRCDILIGIVSLDSHHDLRRHPASSKLLVPMISDASASPSDHGFSRPTLNLYNSAQDNDVLRAFEWELLIIPRPITPSRNDLIA